MKIEIWMEGYRSNGDSSVAEKIGEYEADDFDHAIRMYDEDHPGQVENLYEYGKPYHIWQRLLYDNEVDARKRFG
jgi:hypothetical protein